MTTNNSPTLRTPRSSRAIAAIALGVGLAAFASVPSSFAADWHDRGGVHASHGPVFHDYRGGRGYYRGGFGFGFSLADPYPYYGYSPYAYADPGYAYPPPVAAVDPSAPTYTASNGETCRDYPTTRIINGASEQILATMCLQPDGSWRAVN